MKSVLWQRTGTEARINRSWSSATENQKDTQTASQSAMLREREREREGVSYLVCFVQSVLPGWLPVWAGPPRWGSGREPRRCPAPGEPGSPLVIGCRGSGRRWSERREPPSDWETPGHSWGSDKHIKLTTVLDCWDYQNNNNWNNIC